MSNQLARLFATAALSLVGLAAAMAPVAGAAVPKTGTWSGELVPELKVFTTSNPWKPPITITALDGRIKAVATTVRLECSQPLSIGDIRVVESWRAGRGPRVSKLNGSFAFRADGVYFHGRLSRSFATGGASMSRGEFCHASARFNIRRGRY